MIDWKKYFDAIYCIHFIPYVERIERLTSEFERVGIMDSGIFHWKYTFPSVYDNIMFKILNSNGCSTIQTITQLSILLAHYSVIKECFLRNFNNVLIMEDDIAFLKDLKSIEIILEDIPTTYAICLFDHLRPQNISKTEYDSYFSNSVNKSFSKYKTLYSCGCYSLTRNGMEQLIHLYESGIKPADVYTTDETLESVGGKIFSKINLCCQLTYKISSNSSIWGENSLHRVYGSQDLIYSKYNVGDFNYGDIIKQ